MEQSVRDLPPDTREALVTRLEQAPVTLALVFGTYATGQATNESDIDIAIEYNASITDVTGVHLSLVADLTQILGRDDIDVVRLTTVDPRIAVEALENGHLLVGTSEDAQRLRNRLETPRKRREEIVHHRIEEAEQQIERRLQCREYGR